MNDLTSERSYDSQVTLAINVRGLIFDLLPMSVCTTGHWQTSGRLEQKFDVSAVYIKDKTEIFFFS